MLRMREELPEKGTVKERKMERLEAFEKMLADVKEHAAYEAAEMEKLKQAGKEKSATYRQYLGHHLYYKQLLDTYRKYGLTD